jgi:hypothetical protein
MQVFPGWVCAECHKPFSDLHNLLGHGLQVQHGIGFGLCEACGRVSPQHLVQQHPMQHVAQPMLPRRSSGPHAACQAQAVQSSPCNTAALRRCRPLFPRPVRALQVPPFLSCRHPSCIYLQARL